MKPNVKTIRLLVLWGAVAMCCLSSAAQDIKSGFFVDDYTYRFQINPAISNSRNFVAMPALGNLNVGLTGNLHLTDVIYNVNGRTTTFMNPGVSAAEVMSNLSDVNKINTDVRLTLLAGGFKAFGGYNTVTLSARARVNARLPKSLFSFLKEGVENKRYDISDVRASAMGYAELAFNHSRALTPEWRVGATTKLLLGIGGAEADFNRAELDLAADGWNVTTDARLRTYLNGYSYKTKLSKNTGNQYVNGLDGSFSAVNGFGLAFDLGAVYTPKQLKDWAFYLSVTDLGFISWSHTLEASTNGERSFHSDDFTFNADDNADNSFSKEWKNVKKKISALYELDNNGDTGSTATMLHATVNAGVKYNFPLYRKLDFGLLNTTCIAGDFTWTDFRLSANVAPCKVFSGGVNLGVGTYGAAFGWIANVHLTGFNFFISQDNTFARIAKQGVPLKSNANVALGMNFLF